MKIEFSSHRCRMKRLGELYWNGLPSALFQDPGTPPSIVIENFQLLLDRISQNLAIPRDVFVGTPRCSLNSLQEVFAEMTAPQLGVPHD